MFIQLCYVATFGVTKIFFNVFESLLGSSRLKLKHDTVKNSGEILQFKIRVFYSNKLEM